MPKCRKNGMINLTGFQVSVVLLSEVGLILVLELYFPDLLVVAGMLLLMFYCIFMLVSAIIFSIISPHVD